MCIGTVPKKAIVLLIVKRHAIVSV
jgi:hypothetical protein